MGGTDQRIGSETPGDGNVISGNDGPGIRVVDANASIQGNRIGTNTAGTGAVGNGLGGIEVDGGFVGIGGSVLGTGNQISGNFGDGLLFHNDADGQVDGNLIGTNFAGTGAISNTGNGVTIDSASATLGGNVISGNAGSGVLIENTPGLGILSTLNDNYIGTNASGTAAVPNAVGVVVSNADNQVIGTDLGGSLISGNFGPGIIVNSGSTGTEISGNRIGLNFSSTPRSRTVTPASTSTRARAGRSSAATPI